jgi:hypothetical protein
MTSIPPSDQTDPAARTTGRRGQLMTVGIVLLVAVVVILVLLL